MLSEKGTTYEVSAEDTLYLLGSTDPGIGDLINLSGELIQAASTTTKSLGDAIEELGSIGDSATDKISTNTVVKTEILDSIGSQVEVSEKLELPDSVKKDTINNRAK